MRSCPKAARRRRRLSSRTIARPYCGGIPGERARRCAGREQVKIERFSRRPAWVAETMGAGVAATSTMVRKTIGEEKAGRCLGWNIAGRKPQAEIRDGRRDSGNFGDYFTIPLLVEAIDHDAIEAAESPRFRWRLNCERSEISAAWLHAGKRGPEVGIEVNGFEGIGALAKLQLQQCTPSCRWTMQSISCTAPPGRMRRACSGVVAEEMRSKCLKLFHSQDELEQ